eukprot:Clim_evm33s151 gene=Clim_evmTU33s151
MNEQLRDALDCLYDARVPTSWLKVSWPSATLGFWFTELIERHQQFFTWLFSGRPTCFWLTGFFNPQGFLTSVRQEITRAHKGWALDNVKLTSEVGVYIHGLFLDGAGWDRKNIKLIEQNPKVLFAPLPLVWVSAINSTTDYQDRRFYQCPVYTNRTRTAINYIFNVDLRTGTNSSDYWTLRGVALLCSTQ